MKWKRSLLLWNGIRSRQRSLRLITRKQSTPSSPAFLLQFRSIKLIGFIDSGRGEKRNQLFSSSIDSFKRINEERVDFSLLNQTILLSWRPVCWPEAHNQLSFQREANPPREKRKVFISFHLGLSSLKERGYERNAPNQTKQMEGKGSEIKEEK